MGKRSYTQRTTQDGATEHIVKSGAAPTATEKHDIAQRLLQNEGQDESLFENCKGSLGATHSARESNAKAAQEHGSLELQRQPQVSMELEHCKGGPRANDIARELQREYLCALVDVCMESRKDS